MTKRRQKLLELVKEEAKFLRKKLTKEEKEKLDFETFCPRLVSKCVYGQATGSCNSQRALELIMEGCQRVYKNDEEHDLQDLPLNGKPYIPTKEAWWGEVIRIANYYSPIEVYIAEDDETNNYNLLEYIKGTKKTLKIS